MTQTCFGSSSKYRWYTQHYGGIRVSSSELEAAAVSRPLSLLHIIFSTMTKGYLTFLAFMAAAAATASASGAVELTLENFKDKVKGKNAFVKFLAPW
jgi:hypothetical protein